MCSIFHNDQSYVAMLIANPCWSFDYTFFNCPHQNWVHSFFPFSHIDCLRMVWILTKASISSCDGSKKGDLLRYEQPFCICDIKEKVYSIYEIIILFRNVPYASCIENHRMIDLSLQKFLFSDVSSLHSSAKLSRHNPVTLADLPSQRTMWRIMPFNPKLRMELEGTPILVNARASTG